MKPFRQYTLLQRGSVKPTIQTTATDDPVRARFKGSTVYPVDNVQSRQVLSENPKRKYLLVQNLSAGTVYIQMGGPASAAQSIAIFSNGNREINAPTAVNSVHIIGTLATQEVRIEEG